jgi:hypothetical protein
MKALTCAATRLRLQAFHDRELNVRDQIAVSAHLDWCDACTEELGDLRAIGVTLSALGAHSGALTHEEAGAFNADVVSRLKAQHDESFWVRAQALLDEPHLLYAGLGAAFASAVCLVVMLSMMRFATTERPDSLAGIVTLLATPLECQVSTEIAADPSVCRERWVERFQRANEAAEQDAVFTLEAVLTTDKHLPNLRGSHPRGGRTEPGQTKLIEGLLDVVSRSRLDGGQAPQTPASTGSMLWLVARETVRATKPAPSLDVPLPPKKRAEGLTHALRVTRA